MSERVLIARVHPDFVHVSSAGTYGLIGRSMDPQAALVTRELGADPEGHEAREITAEMIAAADLVLGATEEHRDFALRLQPRAMRRTFTIREFVRLGRDVHESLPATDGRADLARIAQVAARRGVAPVAEPGADDIGDPFGGPVAGMRACGARITDAVDDLIRILDLPRRG